MYFRMRNENHCWMSVEDFLDAFRNVWFFFRSWQSSIDSWWMYEFWHKKESWCNSNSCLHVILWIQRYLGVQGKPLLIWNYYSHLQKSLVILIGFSLMHLWFVVLPTTLVLFLRLDVGYGLSSLIYMCKL